MTTTTHASDTTTPRRSDTTADRTADDTLARLLDDELAYSPIARHGYINHLAMSLVAARRLGADSTELQRWYDAQTDGDFLVPRQRPEWLPDELADLDERGIDAVVRDRLPALVDRPGAQFFHAIIRLDLALDAAHPAQVANALRNWEHDHAHPDPLDDSRSPGTGDLLAGADLDRLARIALASHQDPGHFGTLHLVTGVRAARAVQHHLDDAARASLTEHTARAVASALAQYDLLELLEDPAVERVEPLGDATEQGPSWSELSVGALASTDPHVAKVVYASRIEHELTGDARYLGVAARQVATAG